MTGGGLPEEVMFESRFESRRRSRPWEDLGKAYQGKGTTSAKALRQDYPAQLRNSQEVIVDGAQCGAVSSER